MKLFLATLLVAIFVALAMAADEPQKAIIVSYPEGAPDSEMDELRKAIDKVVRSDYADIVMGLGSPFRNREASSPTSTISLMGLAAKVPATFVETIRTMGADHKVKVEEDETVSINDHSS